LPTYAAPEEMKQFEMGSTDSERLSPESELFSIGLTLLSAATEEDFLHVYNMETYHFNFDFIT
jgi:hypothetical protein